MMPDVCIPAFAMEDLGALFHVEQGTGRYGDEKRSGWDGRAHDHIRSEFDPETLHQTDVVSPLHLICIKTSGDLRVGIDAGHE